MKLEMYAIKDELDGYTTPIPLPTEKVAIRWFLTMKETNIDMKNNENDYSLWKVGEWNKDTGEWNEERRKIDV